MNRLEIKDDCDAEKIVDDALAEYRLKHGTCPAIRLDQERGYYCKLERHTNCPYEGTQYAIFTGYGAKGRYKCTMPCDKDKRRDAQ